MQPFIVRYQIASDRDRNELTECNRTEGGSASFVAYIKRLHCENMQPFIVRYQIGSDRDRNVADRM